MPELPEVETTRRGIAPYLVGRRLTDWTLRVPALRWPLVLPDAIRGQRITALRRRATELDIDHVTIQTEEIGTEESERHD